jgi:hypothetical protein
MSGQAKRMDGGRVDWFSWEAGKEILADEHTHPFHSNKESLQGG